MSLEAIAAQAVSGLIVATQLFLVASGLTLIFGVARIINMAHASFYMFGAYLFYVVTDRIGNLTIGYVVALITVPLMVAALATVLEVVIYRRVYHHGMFVVAMLSFGLVFIAEGMARVIFGNQAYLVELPEVLRGSIYVGSYGFPAFSVPVLVMAPLVALAIWAVFYRTRFGIVVRAATMDPEMLNALGINVPRVTTITFAAAAWLAALGGILAAPTTALLPTMDSDILIEAFAVVVIGGLGSVAGSVLAALIIGELLAFGLLAFPALSLVLVFVIMAVVLVIRPWGLRGSPMPD